MEDNDTKKEILRVGSESEFWRLVCEKIDAKVVMIQDFLDSAEMIDLPLAEYKTINEILKAKKSYLNELKDLPNKIIIETENPNIEQDILDPYQTKEELEQD